MAKTRSTFDIVEWSDPPPRRPRGGLWTDRLLPLVEKPGQWAKLGEGPRRTIQVTAHNLNKGKYKTPDEYEFEFAARPADSITNDVYGLWGRCIG